MNNSCCIMIQYVMKSYEGIAEEQLAALQKKMLQDWPHINITLRSCQDYWKFEGYKKIVYGISSKQLLKVKELIAAFEVTWNYTEGGAYDVETQREYLNESAIWSQSCNPNEIFVTPQVEWVHMYTWPEQSEDE